MPDNHQQENPDPAPGREPDLDEGVPSIREIADLLRRLRALSTAGRDADPAERAAFLADKDALITRIHADRRAGAAHGAGLDREPLRAERPTTTTDDAGRPDDAHDDGQEWSR